MSQMCHTTAAWKEWSSHTTQKRIHGTVHVLNQQDHAHTNTLQNGIYFKLAAVFSER